MTASKPPILLIHDGELRDVEALLHELGADHLRLGVHEAQERAESPERLLIASARYASSAKERGEPSDRSREPVRIVVGDASLPTQRIPLRKAGFDFLVCRPVHASALRMLLLHALYKGEERRHATRFAFGYPVTYGARAWHDKVPLATYAFRFRHREAILAELSARGCRLISTFSPEPAARIWVELPAEVASGRRFKIYGRVVRNEPWRSEDRSAEQRAIGMEFDRLEGAAWKRLRWILLERKSGPAILPGVAAPAPTSTDRRRAPRSAYRGEVIAIHGGVSILVGRDLSPEGMRVEPHPMLAVGDRLQLSLCFDSEGPFLVDASVVRDDREAGLALRFEPADLEARSKLECLVKALPSIRSLGSAGDDAILLTEIVSAAP